jgi:hypothetical protein
MGCLEGGLTPPLHPEQHRRNRADERVSDMVMTSPGQEATLGRVSAWIRRLRKRGIGEIDGLAVSDLEAIAALASPDVGEVTEEMTTAGEAEMNRRLVGLVRGLDYAPILTAIYLTMRRAALSTVRSADG